MADKTKQVNVLKKRCRIILGAFVVGLLLSGLTAAPLRWEVEILNNSIGEGTSTERIYPPMAHWISHVHDGIMEVGEKWPFMYYGTDWLFFAHVVIAISFIGPLRDPVRNVWVVEYGMIACVLVIPMVFIFAPLRGIPFFWRLIDCSFGIVGIVPLAICRSYIKKMEALPKCLHMSAQEA